jgi:hypothetical protein
MKRIILIMLLIIPVLVTAVYSQGTKQQGNQEYTATGTITAAEFQGNNYLKLTLAPSKDNENIFVWCSGGKTKVYASEKPAVWTALTPGRKIKVIGSWIVQGGEKLLWASRIDLLQKDPE